MLVPDILHQREHRVRGPQIRELGPPGPSWLPLLLDAFVLKVLTGAAEDFIEGADPLDADAGKGVEKLRALYRLVGRRQSEPDYRLIYGTTPS